MFVDFLELNNIYFQISENASVNITEQFGFDLAWPLSLRLVSLLSSLIFFCGSKRCETLDKWHSKLTYTFLIVNVSAFCSYFWWRKFWTCPMPLCCPCRMAILKINSVSVIFDFIMKLISSYNMVETNILRVLEVNIHTLSVGHYYEVTQKFWNQFATS